MRCQFLSLIEYVCCSSNLNVKLGFNTHKCNNWLVDEEEGIINPHIVVLAEMLQ